MTRRKWTTTEQEDWLKSHLAEFADAQVNKTTSKEFFPMILKEWQKTWPTPGPTEEEIAKAGNVEKATLKKKTEEDTRIRAWFHNHTRGTMSGSGTRGLLKMKGKQKTLQEWQVYHIMTYENQWKPVIEKEWETYKITWEAENPGEEPNETRFAFMNAFMRQKYLEETEEVKADVRKRREELKKEMEADGEDKNLAYQSAIDRLPRTLAVWGESICNQTGWNITFLVGGPSPRQNGQIMTYMLHCGKSPDGQDFQEFLGKDGYDEYIITPFDDFLQEAFPPEVCNARKLETKDGTPESDENGSDDETSNNRIRDKETSGLADAAGDSAEPVQKSGKSEHEHSRDANIMKNKELLQQLGLLEFSWGDEADKSSRKKKDKKKKDKKKSILPTRSSDRLSDPSTAATVSENKDANDGVVSISTNPEVIEDMPVISAGQSAIDTDQTLSPTEIGVAVRLVVHPSPSFGSSPLPQPASSSGGPGPSAISCSTTDVVSTIEATSSHGTAAPPESPDSPGPLTTNSDSGPRGPEQATKTTTPPASPSATSLPAPSSAPAPSTTTNDTESTMNADPMQVDDVAGVETPSSSSTTVAMVAPPAWLTSINMDIYLQGCSGTKAWQSLVGSLYRFEKLNTINGNLPTTVRPDEVSSWIKSKKKNSPPEVDADEYGSSFMQWWIALQPSWRLADNGSFNYEAPADEDWRVLRKGGSAGLYTVVVALSWWVRALTADAPSFRAWTAVRDVQWVIEQIIKTHSGAAKKRTLEDAPRAGKSKRVRHG